MPLAQVAAVISKDKGRPAGFQPQTPAPKMNTPAPKLGAITLTAAQNATNAARRLAVKNKRIDEITALKIALELSKDLLAKASAPLRAPAAEEVDPLSTLPEGHPLSTAQASAMTIDDAAVPDASFTRPPTPSEDASESDEEEAKEEPLLPQAGTVVRNIVANPQVGAAMAIVNAPPIARACPLLNNNVLSHDQYCAIATILEETMDTVVAKTLTRAELITIGHRLSTIALQAIPEVPLAGTSVDVALAGMD